VGATTHRRRQRDAVAGAPWWHLEETRVCSHIFPCFSRSRRRLNAATFDRTSENVAPFCYAPTARAPKSANAETEARRPPWWHLVAPPASAATGTFHVVRRSTPVAPLATTAARSVRRQAASMFARFTPPTPLHYSPRTTLVVPLT